jgi:hypothetical protein
MASIPLRTKFTLGMMTVLPLFQNLPPLDLSKWPHVRFFKGFEKQNNEYFSNLFGSVSKDFRKMVESKAEKSIGFFPWNFWLFCHPRTSLVGFNEFLLFFMEDKYL